MRTVRTDLSGVVAAVKYYLDLGWRVDHIPEAVDDDFIICSPSGTAYMSSDLRRRTCPFCDEYSPEWEEGFCSHSEELINEELNARNLLSLIELEPSLQRDLP